MRIIGTLSNENHARRFCAYLKREQIATSCEMTFDTTNGHMSYPIWVHDEDKIEQAAGLFNEFEKNPSDPKYDVPILEQAAPEEPVSTEDPEEGTKEPRAPTRITHFFLFFCALVFFLNYLQEAAHPNHPVTPVQQTLLYDLPPTFARVEEIVEKYQLTPEQTLEQLPPAAQAEVAELNKIPYFRGFYDWILLKVTGQDTFLALGPMFTKIREGEVWRLFSPAILHRDFLHILFNMIWLWILGRPIEQRIGALRTLVLTFIVGVISNTAQYLMGGPYFLGYSGVVMGLAGFIWMREKLAPWEGYPLHRSTILFLVFFVLAMAALQLGSFLLLVFTTVQFNPSIANTAHIVGALVGALLGCYSFFASRPIQ